MINNEFAGIYKVEALNHNHILFYSDYSPTKPVIVSLQIIDGEQWIDIPFVPETAFFKSVKKDTVESTLSLQVNAASYEARTLIDQLLSNSYILRITNNNGQVFIIGTDMFPGRFIQGIIDFKTNALELVQNGITFKAITPHFYNEVVS